MALPAPAGYKPCMPRLVSACVAVAAIVIADRWWIELPLAGAILAMLMWPRRARHEVASGPPSAVQRADAIDEVVLAVNRGGHVEEVLSNLARQACSIMRVERAIVMLRDETDPRSSVVVAGYGVP